MAKKTGKQKTTKKASTPNKQTDGKQKQKAKFRFRAGCARRFGPIAEGHQSGGQGKAEPRVSR